jgi:hypothetical protein
MEWSVAALAIFCIPPAIARKTVDPIHHRISVWLSQINLLLVTRLRLQ